MRNSLLLALITVSVLAAFDKQKQHTVVAYDFEVTAYDLVFELDALGKLKSMQEIGIVNVSAKSVKNIYFLLQPDLLIENISVLNNKGKSLPVSGWERVGVQQSLDSFRHFS